VRQTCSNFSEIHEIMKTSLFIASLSTILMLWHCDQVDAILIDISGNVSADGTPVSGALVLLVEGANLANGVSLANGSLSLGNGNFVIIEPDKGKYYVVAIDDVNDNLQYDQGVDRFGFYGMNPAASDFTPQRITVGSTDLEGINIVSLTSL